MSETTQTILDLTHRPSREERLAELLADDGDLRVRVGMDFKDDFHEKFLRGNREHGGILTHKNCLPEAWNEVLDLAAYIKAIEDQHMAVRDVCRGMQYGSIDYAEGIELIQVILHLEPK